LTYALLMQVMPAGQQQQQQQQQQQFAASYQRKYRVKEKFKRLQSHLKTLREYKMSANDNRNSFCTPSYLQAKMFAQIQVV